MRKGDRVLDLCCGTGGEAFLAAEAVGEQGRVVAVDVTEGMLAVLKERQQQQPQLGQRITVFRHDVTDLDGLAAATAAAAASTGGEVVVAKGTFDVLLCSTAFVLLQNPAKVVAQWAEYLRPGGHMVIDIPHEHNLRAGRVLENVVRHQLHEGFPSNRSWVESQESFQRILEEGAGNELRVEAVHVLENITGHGTRYFGVEEAESMFEQTMETSLTAGTVLKEGFKERVRPLFVKAWEEAAVDGKVENVDVLYVYVVRKTE